MNQLEALWYRHRYHPWHVLLLPLSALFRLLVAVRRGLYRCGILRSYRLAVPVVVVGNITVGGTGKTPLVLWLARFFTDLGFHPGIVSRGYASANNAPRAVRPDGDPAQCGDEPLLLARRSACPVWVGKNRVATAQALLQAEPQCNLLLCDDGLQHYRLRRDVEIAVVDGTRNFGNGWMLPAGPLREDVARLRTVDAVVVNGGADKKVAGYAMTLVGSTFRNLVNPARTAQAADFAGKHLDAVAAIGNPQRFFDQLRGMGLDFMSHAFQDHHRFRADDLHFFASDAVLMTEKDAVKCAAFARNNWWMLAVDAQVDAALGEKILERLRIIHGRQIA